MYAFAMCMPRPRIVDPPTSTNRWFTSSVDVLKSATVGMLKVLCNHYHTYRFV